MTGAAPARLALHTAQPQLFDSADALPPGLALAPAFIGTDSERQLIALAAALPLSEARYKGYTARRRVFVYGAPAGGEVDGRSHQRATPAALPPPLLALREQFAAWAGVDPGAFVHVMVAEYQRGTPVGWHRDAPQHDLIAGVSLAGPARLRFRPWPPRGGGNDDVIALELAPRSAYLMRDAARWGWQHSVPPVPALRYSVTMRTARR